MISNKVLFKLGITISQQLLMIQRALVRPSAEDKVCDDYVDRMEWVCIGCKDREATSVLRALKSWQDARKRERKKRDQENLEKLFAGDYRANEGNS